MNVSINPTLLILHLHLQTRKSRAKRVFVCVFVCMNVSITPTRLVLYLC
jgi:hypothetical protein